MSTFIHYSNCPICQSDRIVPFLQAKDHTVSGEVFAVWKCEACLGAFTQDIPGQEQIGAYYKADSYVSHTDTQTGLVNQLYHRVRKITLNSKKDLVASTCGIKQGSLLDIGAGTGAFAGFMKSAGWSVTGLEPDPEARNLARERNNIDLLSPDHLYSLPEKSFDAITLWHVLEHVHDLHGYMERIRQLLKPGGKAFIAVPNHTSHDALKYQQYWAAWDVPRHLYHFSPAAMKQLFSQHGLSLYKMKPMWFDSFYVSMLSVQHRSGGSGFIPGMLMGAVSNLYALGSVAKCSSVIYIASC